MRFLTVVFSVALFANVAVAAAPRATAKKKPSSAQTKHRRASKSSKKPAATAARRSFQQQPTPERYKEIQQALIDKGYLTGSPEGTWGPSSVDALKRFQRDQNLTEDGKIGSLSLIALGLGPKRTTQTDASLDKQP